MNFVFNQMAAYNDTPFASLMVNSILKFMPDACIVQMSDRDAKPIKGVSVVFKGDFVYTHDEYARVFFRMMQLPGKNPMVYCDADMVFNGDIADLLKDDFDIAICRRSPDDGTSISYRIIHPYNIGFMVTKTPKFYEVCDSVLHTFFGGSEFGIAQHIVGLAVNSGEFKVKFLDGNIYNRMPKDPLEFDPNVKVWHFKGDRKAWMPEWVKRYGDRAS